MAGRYQALDAMRVAGSLIVVTYHYPALAFGLRPASGFLAVDLFFMLSGFVVASTYGERLAAPASALPFLADRLARFWPLHSVALLTGVGLAVAALMAGREYNAVTAPGAGLLMGLAFLPYGGGFVFALNPPAWSLALELIANAIYAASAGRLSDRRLLIAVGCCGAILAGCVLWTGSADLGATRLTFAAGLVRVGYGFGMGVLLFRIRSRTGPPRRWTVVLPPLAIGLLMLRPQSGALYDMFFIGVAAPLAIWACASRSLRLPGISKAANYTFAAYILHYPVLFGVVRLLDRAPVFEKAAPALLPLALCLASWGGFVVSRRARNGLRALSRRSTLGAPAALSPLRT